MCTPRCVLARTHAHTPRTHAHTRTAHARTHEHTPCAQATKARVAIANKESAIAQDIATAQLEAAAERMEADATRNQVALGKYRGAMGGLRGRRTTHAYRGAAPLQARDTGGAQTDRGPRKERETFWNVPGKGEREGRPGPDRKFYLPELGKFEHARMMATNRRVFGRDRGVGW